MPTNKDNDCMIDVEIAKLSEIEGGWVCDNWVYKLFVLGSKNTTLYSDHRETQGNKKYHCPFLFLAQSGI